MRLDLLRRRFPEYGDMSDDDFMDAMHSFISDITTEAPGKPIETIEAPGVELAIGELKKTLDKANLALSALVKQGMKEEMDMSPHFMAMGVQLAKIEEAITSMEMPKMPEPMKMEMPMTCKSFKVVRDEIGQIEKVIPEYEAS